MKIKQVFGSILISIVLLCTLLGLAGVWGFVEGDTGWQLFYSLIVVAIGTGSASGMIDVYFKDDSQLLAYFKTKDKKDA